MRKPRSSDHFFRDFRIRIYREIMERVERLALCTGQKPKDIILESIPLGIARIEAEIARKKVDMNLPRHTKETPQTPGIALDYRPE